MHPIRTCLGATLLLAVAVVACSGAPATTSPGGGSPAAPTTAAGGAASASANPGGGGAVGDACALLATSAVEAALDATGVTATGTPANGGDFSYCSYIAGDGSPLMATSYTTTQSAVFDAFKGGGEGVVVVPGIGEGEAILVDSGGSPILMVRQGTNVFTLQPSGGIDLEGDELVAALTEAARAAAPNF